MVEGTPLVAYVFDAKGTEKMMRKIVARKRNFDLIFVLKYMENIYILSYIYIKSSMRFFSLGKTFNFFQLGGLTPKLDYSVT